VLTLKAAGMLDVDAGEIITQGVLRIDGDRIAGVGSKSLPSPARACARSWKSAPQPGFPTSSPTGSLEIGVPPFSGLGAAAMSLHVRNLRFRDIGRMVLIRHQLIFLVAGVLTFIVGVALPNIVMCICGLLVAGSFAWDVVPQTPENARVRMWQWLDKTRARRR
jgi:adhesin HecA-like repeat protein